mgnify:CR=1 FL=1
MKKLNVLLTASLLGLALTGTALLADAASAKDPSPQNTQQAEAKKHPEKRRHTDEDDVEWHRL